MSQEDRSFTDLVHHPKTLDFLGINNTNLSSITKTYTIYLNCLKNSFFRKLINLFMMNVKYKESKLKTESYITQC